MSSRLGFICFFSVLIFSSCAYSWPEEEAAANSNSSAYEALEQYGFPVGLLPEGVTDYVLDPSTGEFSVSLSGACAFTLADSFSLKYEPTVSGLISKDRLREVRGVSFVVVKRRLRIVEVRKEGGMLVFSVGPSSADFPVQDFAVSPKCGCGFSCDVAAGDHRRRPGNIYQSWRNLMYMSS